MGSLNPLGIVALIGLFGFGFWSGSCTIQAQWDRAQNKALEKQQELEAQSESERRALNAQVMELTLNLESAALEAARLSEDIQNAINRAPVVRTIEVAGECHVPDSREHYRLFNCAIRNSCKALPDAGEADLRDATVPGSDSITGLDGVHRPEYSSTAF